MRVFNAMWIIDPLMNDASPPERWGIAKFGGDQGGGALSGLIGSMPGMAMGAPGGGAPPSPGATLSGGANPGALSAPPTSGFTPNNMKMLMNSAQLMNQSAPHLMSAGPSPMGMGGDPGNVMQRIQQLQQIDPNALKAALARFGIGGGAPLGGGPGFGPNLS